MKIPDWITPIYEQIKAEYPALLLPKAEKTNIKNWDFESLQLTNPIIYENKVPDVAAHLVDEADKNIIVVCDGAIVYKRLSVDFEDVIITTLQNALEQHEDLVKSYFGKVIPFNTNRLTALNFLNLNSGLFIYVPKNKVIGTPLNVIFIQEGRSLLNRNLIVANQSSQLEYIENYVNQSAAVINLCTEIIVGENAQLDFVAMDCFHKDVIAYECKRSAVEANGSLSLSHGALSDGNVVSENLVSLVGSGASAQVKSVAIAENAQKQNITVEVEHLAPHTAGDIINHGISKDEAQLTFNGIGRIHKGMRGSDAQQSSRVMILSEKARADANPLLLIEEYDVSAGHAAGVGKINEEQLYYLMSRGLTRREAESLIIHGFLMPFIKEIKNEAVQAEFVNVIERKIKA